MATIEIRKDKRGQFRFSVKSRNGETIATGESYKQKAKAMATARSLATQLAKAKVLDLTQLQAAKSSATKVTKTPVAKKMARKAATKPPGKATPKAAKSFKKPSPAKTASAASPKIAAKVSRPAAPSKPVGRPRRAAEELSPREAEPIRTPAGGRPTSAGSRVVSRGDETRPTEADDELDTVAQAEGNDILRPDQLGDGERAVDGGDSSGDAGDDNAVQ